MRSLKSPTNVFGLNAGSVTVYLRANDDLAYGATGVVPHPSLLATVWLRLRPSKELKDFDEFVDCIYDADAQLLRRCLYTELGLVPRGGVQEIPPEIKSIVESCVASLLV